MTLRSVAVGGVILFRARQRMPSESRALEGDLATANLNCKDGRWTHQ